MRTYGDVVLRDGFWLVKAEPHIMLRLKRVFASISASDYGVIRISDTTDNCRHLEWFMEMYPMLVSPAAHLERRAEEAREGAALVEAMLSKRIPPPDFKLALPLREYQRLPGGMVLRTGGLLCADDVGLGKTPTAIAIFTDPRTLPALVVTLANLPTQWERQVHKFAPALRTHVLRTGTPYDLTERVGRRSGGRAPTEAMPDVIITSYTKLRGWAETLAPIVRSMVLDECQEVRHDKNGQNLSQKYAAAKHIAENVDFRLGLSATPIFNWGGELFNLFGILQPGILGTRTEFLQEHCDGGGEKPRLKDPKAFGFYLREAGLMVRRTRKDVGRELPPVSKIIHHVECDPKALESVGGSAAELARIILSQGESKPGAKLEASQQLSNVLRQATGIGKAPFVAAFVRLLVESGEKVVLFGWHREVYRIWMAALKDLEPALYTGSESTKKKDEAQQSFIDGKTSVLIMSLRSGAGLDGLQHVCRTCVIGELDWSPGVLEQDIGRIARDEQRDPVMAYYLVADEGADPVMTDVLGLKAAQLEGVRNPKADLIEELETDAGHVKRLAENFLKQRRDWHSPRKAG